MIGGTVKRVGIIGAGIAGLTVAKTLLAEGYDCTVFDRAAELGGVWADGYVNFGVQIQKELYEFPDFPLPDHVPDFTPGPMLQGYLEDYCAHFKVTPALRLATRVLSVFRPVDGADGWTVRLEAEGAEREEQFDLIVIATGLFSETPNIPEYPGQSEFVGQILHNSDLKTHAPLEGRRVVVVGYGKSATDAAAEAVAAGCETDMVFRNVHWPVPRKLAGLVPFKWGMLSRMTAALIPPYQRPSALVKALHRYGEPLVWVYWRLVELLLRVQFKLDTKIAKGKTLLPARPVEISAFHEATMVPRPGFIEMIRDERITAHRSRIERFTATGVVLEDGDQIEADAVVFATGWRTDYRYLSEKIRAALGEEPDGFYLYRHMLHPGLSNLLFAGRITTYESILSFNLQARWLAECLAGRVELPGPDAMRAEIAAMRRWKQRWMPEGGGRAAMLGLHMIHYHDELLRDFGADPFRKRGFFAPFKELLAPYQSSDYREIAAGTWRK